jgi:translation initiation factor 4G
MVQLGLLVSEDPDEEKRQKEFKSFLNKITPDNYETIRDKIIAVGITSPGTLQGLIDQVLPASFLCDKVAVDYF